MLTTLTRIPLNEISAALSRVLPKEAYKAVTGTRAELTDIRPPYLREKLEEVFGVVGYGWWYTYDDMESEYDKSRNSGNPWTSTIKTLKLYYRYVDSETNQVFVSEPIYATGGISMDRKDFTQRGALTNALGDAAKQLGWQKGVYLGLIDHKNSEKWFKAQQERDKALVEKGKRIPGTPIK